jgi:hypothetical protein
MQDLHGGRRIIQAKKFYQEDEAVFQYVAVKIGLPLS